ncbi:MAG TPA: 50S ribosomal protein L15 [Ktedonobacteraceae bacterium]|nr:50S ribosomal protein L15 [Ktedonobacteraceae bacterium]
MKLSDLHPAPGSRKEERRVGRGHGSGRGKTSGRGQKGQMARTGGKVNRSFNGGQTRLSKRLPFLRGEGAARNAFPSHDGYAIINVDDLSRFEAGSDVSPESFVKQKLLTAAEARGPIKILGNGDVDHAVTVHVHKVSAGAQTKIEAAGGKVEIIPTKVYEKTKRRKDEKMKTNEQEGQDVKA